MSDKHSIQVSAGNGGADAQDWARILLHMLIRYAERSGASVAISEIKRAEGLRIEYAQLVVTGDVSFDSEIGIHRIVRVSPFDPEHRRCTSFALVSRPFASTDEMKLEAAKWAEPIRSYMFLDGSVYDHRTEKRFEDSLGRVLEGELDEVR